MKIKETGSVRISPEGRITVGDGFEFDYTEDNHIAGCRSAAILACLWAIEVLNAEVRKTVEQPGGGNIVLD